MLRKIGIAVVALSGMTFMAMLCLQAYFIATFICEPSPEYWAVRIVDLTLEEVALPDGITLSTSRRGLHVDNQTDTDVMVVRVPPGGNTPALIAPPQGARSISF